MKAPINIELKLPEAIDTAVSDMAKYRSVEARVAYLKLVSQKGEKYYKTKNLWKDEINKNLVGLINVEVYALEKDLIGEHERNKPLGYRFDKEVVEIELEMYDTLEAQIEYLKRKISDFDNDTQNVDTKDFESVKDYLKQQIIKRYNKLKNTECDWEEFQFNEYWDKIFEKHFDPHIINKILEETT